MKQCRIMLKTIDDIRSFVNIVSRFDCDIDLASGRYVVDAKSIMGIFSLDLSKPILVTVRDDRFADEILQAIVPFRIL